MASIANNNWQENMKTISDSVKYIFNNEEMSDIKFVFKSDSSETEVIYAHSWILSLMSSVFYDSFKRNFEVAQVIPITDYSFEVFFEVLQFVYTSECNLTPDNLFDIIAVAKKYYLKSLVEKCTNYMPTMTLRENSVCQILPNINSGFNEFKGKVIDFIGQRMRNVLQEESFLNIDQTSLKEILSINETGPITEVEIFSAAIKWASHNCRSDQMEVNGRNMRHQLGDLIKLIRFPTMTSDEFAECVKEDDGILTLEEKFSLSMTILAKQTNKFGFISEPRKHSIYLQRIQSNCLTCYDTYGQIKYYNEISNGRTKFTVSKTVYLLKMDVGVCDIFKNVTIQIKDDKNTIIYDETLLVASYKWVTFKKPTLLYSNREYILNIYLEDTNDKFYYCDKKTLPWSKIENEVEFKFTELSQLLIGLDFKPFY